MEGIPLYTEINDLHLLTGSALRTKDPLIHCFDMQHANDLRITATPPHRVSFYTLALNFGTEDLSYTLNENTFEDYQNFVLCVAPGQVAQWEKKGEWAGYCLFFKSELLNFSEQVNFLQLYPFFNIRETNLMPIHSEVFKSLSMLLQAILQEQTEDKKYSREVIKSYLQAILWKVRRIYESSDGHHASNRAGDIIASQFQYLVNEMFLANTKVEEYAAILHITPNHLSQTIKDITGKTAKSIISERRLNEAKYLLRYTTNHISEIAHHLSFLEPTHFVKFFKKGASQTPSAYRNYG